MLGVFGNKIQVRPRNEAIRSGLLSLAVAVDVPQTAGFQERLGVIAGNYQNKFENLGNVMMAEFHDTFSENYEDTIKIISDLVDQINDNDIPFVEKYIDYLESNPSK